MSKYINENLILPNDAIIFIYGEHTNEHDFDEKFVTRASICGHFYPGGLGWGGI